MNVQTPPGGTATSTKLVNKLINKIILIFIQQLISGGSTEKVKNIVVVWGEYLSKRKCLSRVDSGLPVWPFCGQITRIWLFIFLLGLEK